MVDNLKCETCGRKTSRLHQAYDEKRKGKYECATCALTDKGMNELQIAGLKKLAKREK